MNWKTTLILLAIVGGLFAFVLIYDNQLDDTKTLQTTAKRVVRDFKVDDVTRVAIARGKGLKDEIVLSKDGSSWKLEKPVADKADDGKVRELVALIEFLDATEVYEGEKAESQKVARGYEDAKAEAQKHGAAFGLAVIFLQIGILLSSIAALLKQKPVYYLGLAVGVVGIVYFVNGFYLFLPA